MSYPSASPYARTPIRNDNFLDVMVNRAIPSTNADVLWVITAAYQYRPDLLAHDLYGDSRLWWVFVQRNPDVINDPLNDFVTGKQIYLPKKETLTRTLGI